MTSVPEYDRAAFRRVTIRNLLTQPSGLPDALPNNAELRRSHAGLGQFLHEAAIAEQPLEFSRALRAATRALAFSCSRRSSSQSRERPLSQWLQNEFFTPLGMTDTKLGLSDEEAESFLPTVLPSIAPNWQSDAEDWGWNSRYWRCLGAPWGGLM